MLTDVQSTASRHTIWANAVQAKWRIICNWAATVLASYTVSTFLHCVADLRL